MTQPTKPTGAPGTTETVRDQLITQCELRGIPGDQPATASLPRPRLDSEPGTDGDPLLTRPARQALRDTQRKMLVADLRVGDTIAKGGSGWIRAARQPSLGREVVIKTLRPTRRTPEDVAALFREAKILGRLDHPHVVPVHGLGISDGNGPYIIMKRVIGTSLLERIRERGPLAGAPLRALREGLRPLIDVCRAVEYAHDQGLVHRDIKPGNIMLGEFGEAYLIDWGSALLMPQDPESRRREISGTPAYMPPEVAQRTGEVGVATDVHLLGATLYHLLCGTPPNPGDTVTAAIEAATTPKAIDPRVPQELRAIWARACAPAPADRYPSVAAFRSALSGFLDRLGALLTLQRADRERQVLEHADTAGTDTTGATDLADRIAALRFAYDEVLHTWPDNARAQAGLSALRVLEADVALKTGNLAGAAAALDGVKAPPAALLERLAAARADRAQQDAALSELSEREASARRLAAGNWARAALALFAGLPPFILGFVFGHRYRTEGSVPIWWLLAVFATSAVITGVVRRRLRSSELLRSRRYRIFIDAFEALLWVATVASAAAWLADMSLPKTLFLLCTVGVSVAISVAIAVDRWLWLSAIWASLTTVAVALLPAWSAELVGTGLFVNGLILAVILRYGGQLGRPDWRDLGPSTAEKEP